MGIRKFHFWDGIVVGLGPHPTVLEGIVGIKLGTKPVEPQSKQEPYFPPALSLRPSKVHFPTDAALSWLPRNYPL